MLAALTDFQNALKVTPKIQKLINQISSEVAELNEYLPSIIVLCRFELINKEMWDIIKKITQTKF